jgi:hypothetical protein
MHYVYMHSISNVSRIVETSYNFERTEYISILDVETFFLIRMSSDNLNREYFQIVQFKFEPVSRYNPI